MIKVLNTVYFTQMVQLKGHRSTFNTHSGEIEYTCLISWPLLAAHNIVSMMSASQYKRPTYLQKE